MPPKIGAIVWFFVHFNGILKTIGFDAIVLFCFVFGAILFWNMF